MTELDIHNNPGPDDVTVTCLRKTVTEDRSTTENTTANSAMPMDRNVTIEELRLKVSGFRDNRNWLKYHTPKNLAMSITIESAELLEHFQWKTDAEASRELEDEHKIGEVADELADIIIYCLALSDVLRIDLAGAITRKIQKNAERYPIASA